MSREPLPAELLERWLTCEEDPELVEQMRVSLATPTSRRALRDDLHLHGLLQLAVEEVGATDLAADVVQRLAYEAEAPRFARQWQRRQRRIGWRPVWAAAALLLLGLAGWGWWSWSTPVPMLLVDGRQQVLHSGLTITAPVDGQRILWPARGLDCRLAAGTRLRWQGPPATAELLLEQGEVACRLDRRPTTPPLVMRLPGLVATVTGTRWHGEVNERGSLIAVTRGEVLVAVGAEQRRRHAGEAALVAREGEVTWLRGDLASARAALMRDPDDVATDATARPADEPEPAPLVGAPSWQLLPVDAAVERGASLLGLDATELEPFHVVLLPEGEKDVIREGALPGPWSMHNWEDAGRSELFTDQVDGEPVLVLRNLVGHGLLLSQWRPLEVAPGTSLVVDVDYRYRGAGQLALAATFGETRSEPGVRLAAAGPGWQQASFLCHLPPGHGDRPFTLLLFSQRIGSANDVLLRRVQVAPLLNGP